MGGGPPTQDCTTAEELALDLNKGKPDSKWVCPISEDSFMPECSSEY